jgi:hypothetical protein
MLMNGRESGECYGMCSEECLFCRKAVKAERDGLILEIQSVNDDMEQQILVRDKTEYIAMESVPSIDHLKKLNDKLEV